RARREVRSVGCHLGRVEQTARRAATDGPHLHHRRLHHACDGNQNFWRRAREREVDTVPHFAKPAEGSWTQHYPELGTAPVDYSDSIDPARYEAEREAIFKRTWLNVGRVERLPKTGSYFTRELAVAGTSLIIVRGRDSQVRAFHNICRHRGNKLVWNDFPREETAGTCRQFTCKYHGWRYGLDGENTFIQQEKEFFGVDKSQYGLKGVR